MASEQHTVRSISWNEVFSYAHIFKSFKMAIHPNKIILALMAIFLTALFGWVAERVWTGVSDDNWVQKDEPWRYWKEDRTTFRQERQDVLDGRLAAIKELTDGNVIKDETDFDEAYDKLSKRYRGVYDKAIVGADKALTKAKDLAASLPEEERDAALVKAKAARQKARHDAWYDLAKGNRALASKRGQRIFTAFVKWELRSVTNAVRSVAKGSIVSGLSRLREDRGKPTNPYDKLQPVYPADPTSSLNVPKATNNNVDAPYGLIVFLIQMVWGVWWLVSVYPWFAMLLGLFSLAVWSVLGGAICRIAALHAAREEKVSLSAAVRFGLAKWRHFFFAPLMPLGGIVAMGLLIAAGGALGAVPFLGEWFVAVLFLVALGMGAVIAFMTIGLGAGWPMMWPTIAVEGSDSFDAAGRSVNYVFARPFRYAFYWLVAAVYGTICYLFVRLVAFIVLSATHFWAGWGMGLAGRPEYADDAGKLDVMWAKPTFWDFHGPFQCEAMGRSEAGASVVLGFWVYLVAAIVLAFLVTFFFSAATTIYGLMRQKVDATDLDFVDVEEADDLFDDEGAGTAEPDAPAAEAPPAPGDAGEGDTTA